MPKIRAQSTAQIGRGVRKLRLARGWTLDRLAAKAGIDRASLNRLELGHSNPSVLILEKISDALDTNISILIKNGAISLRSSDRELREIIGKNIADLRSYNNWSRAELAERAGYITQYVGTTERGVRLPTIQNLRRFADALGVLPSQLLRADVADTNLSIAKHASWDEEVELSRRIVDIRESKGMNRQELARHSGVDAHHLGRIEKGQTVCTIPTLLVLCAGLGVDISRVVD